MLCLLWTCRDGPLAQQATVIAASWSLRTIGWDSPIFFMMQVGSRKRLVPCASLAQRDIDDKKGRSDVLAGPEWLDQRYYLFQLQGQQVSVASLGPGADCAMLMHTSNVLP